MGFFSWFLNLFPIFNRETGKLDLNNYCTLEAKYNYKALAVETAVNLMSNIFSVATFKTFEKGKEIQNSNFYLLNIEPNINQNANTFWRKVIYNLIYKNECLILQQGTMFYIADEFTRTQRAFTESTYSNIMIGDLSMNKVFKESEVFYLTLHNKKMSDVINGLFEDYGKLIEYSKNTYKRSNARRGTLEIPVNYPQTPKAQEELDKLLKENFKTFFKAEDAALLPLTNGLKYNDLTNHTYKNGSDSRDIRSLIDDMFDYVAIAFQLSPKLLKGDFSDLNNSLDYTLTVGIKPIKDIIESEINRKLYGKSAFLEKSYMKIDVSRIKEISLKDMAVVIDLLSRNGVNSLDDNRKLLDMEEIGGELGKTRLFTKNLGTLEEIKKGGENLEKTKN